MTQDKNNSDFLVIGIGASAGGLEALKGLVSEMPWDKNLALVIIQHLAPDHKSLMGSLLKDLTSMTIKEIEDGMRVEPGNIYLNPPHKNVEIKNGHLNLTEMKDDEVVHLPIDHFLRSLADDKGQKSICIILSGTGSDGTEGLKAIKNAGGMTIVQDKKQAEFGGMPQSAISTGMVDIVLPVEEMPDEILKSLRHPYFVEGTKDDKRKIEFDKNADLIFSLIRKKMNHDFSNYKKSTVYRRIERRMAINQIKEIEEYIKIIKEDEEEVAGLFKDMLITVTNFFRDPEIFEILKQEVLPNLIDNVGTDSSLRIWVPGCATGEEAYSLGIIIAEAMESLNQFVNCQIFASDIDSESIDFARKGIYQENIASDVSKERLDQYFYKMNKGYKVKKQIREMVIFAEQNVIKDPPFSQLDLISCRNVLIYMDRELHDRLIPMFHYALRDNGILVIGSSEGIDKHSNLFKPINRENKIFLRKDTVVSRKQDISDFSFYEKPRGGFEPQSSQESKPVNVQNLAKSLILDKYSYPCVLADEKYEILYFHGNTERYLAPPKGEASFNLLNMARKNLRYKLTTALHKANKEEETIETEDIKIFDQDKTYMIDMIVQPLQKSNKYQKLFMIAFKPKAFTEDDIHQSSEKEPTKEENQRIQALEKELQSTKQSLQTTIEELETSNEELKSSNEELQATNEELQSANEELESAREEAQSTNEELNALNDEYEDKIQKLAKANNDMKNLLDSTEIATIFLDKELNIRRFTPKAKEVFNLIKSDEGRPLDHITSKINYERITQDAEHALDTLEKKEKDIRTDSGIWYAVKILPYRTTENVIDGVLITFTDITEHGKELRRLATVVKDSNDAVTVVDMDGRITEWNKGAEEMYGYAEFEAKKMDIYDLVTDDLKEETKDLLKKIKKDEEIKSFESKRVTKDNNVLDVWLTITKLINDEGEIYAMATTERDITDIKEMKQNYEEKIDELKKELQEYKDS